MKFIKKITHWNVEPGMHARGGEVVHVSIVAPDQLCYLHLHLDDNRFRTRSSWIIMDIVQGGQLFQLIIVR